MAQVSFNTKSPTIKRILKEATELSSHPDPTLHAAPLDSNLFEWHFTMRGPPSTPYSNGIYHGRIILPPTYPLRPPSFRLLTPSGRFEVNREICLSISGHHEETWQPAWGIRTALWALRAFMEGDAKGQVGGMEMGEGERKRLARESGGWRCGGCGGRSNEEVLREEGGSGEVGEKQEVPEELRMGFRDQMEGSGDGKAEGKGKGKEGRISSRASELTTSVAAPSSAQPALASPQSSTVTNIPIIPPPPRPAPIPAVAHRPTTDGVPPWVDKAITGVVTALAVMLIKKIIV